MSAFWYLWLADICEALTLVGVLSCFGITAVCALIGILFLHYEDDDAMRLLDRITTKKKVACFALWVFVSALCLASPSKQTIYLALGFNCTQEVINTPTAQKALELLNLKLDEAIEKSKKE